MEERREADEPVLELFVLGTGFREGVIIHKTGMENPDKEFWALVDCCANSVDDPKANVSLKILRDRGVTKLDFICLTHPHLDHACGIHHFLEDTDIEVERFYIYTEMDAERLSKLFSEAYRKKQRAERSRGDVREGEIKQHDRDISRQLDRLDRVLLSEDRVSKCNVLMLSQGTVLHPYTTSLGASKAAMEDDFSVRSIGPTVRTLKEYWKRVKSWRDENGRIRLAAVRSDLNLLSGCIVIEVGDQTILLAGDVIDAAWDHLINDNLNKPILHPCDVIKVSHHGSEGALGKEQGLWPILTDEGKRRPIVVIAPHIPSGTPSIAAIEYIHQYSDSIFLTKMTPQIESSCEVKYFYNLDEKSELELAEYLGAEEILKDRLSEYNEFERAIIVNLEKPSLYSLLDDVHGCCHFVLKPNGKWDCATPVFPAALIPKPAQ